MNEQIYQIYDRIFKRIFNLSNMAIIGLINGLFGTNYSQDCEVIFPNKEYIGAVLNKKLADVFLIIQGVSYHLEAQINVDGDIIFRAFEYGFHYAINNRDESAILRFPEPIIIYLDSNVSVPPTSTLTLDFGTQGTFNYEVKNFVYQEHEIQELNRRKMILLIPFQLLKLRKIIEKSPTEKHFKMLQELIQNDILASIKANLQVGNITEDDARQLYELTGILYEHIYKHYDELGGNSDMRPLLDGAIELPLDKYRIRIDELEKQNIAIEQEMKKLQVEKSSWEEERKHFEEECKRLREQLEKQK